MATATSEPLRVGEIECRSGQLALGRLLVGYERDGAELNLPVILVNGAQEGPTVYLGALIHGNEPAGAEVIRRVLRECVDPGRLRGSLIGIPIQNPLAYRSSTYHTLDDGLNANRIFPGDASETLTNRMVAQITSQAVEQSQYIIDFHCNVADSILFNFVRWQDSETGRRNLELSRVFGFTSVLSEVKRHGFGFEERLVGLLADEALARGVPALTVELTPTFNWDEPVLAAGVQGTLNVLRHLAMLEGDPMPQDEHLPIINEVLGPQLRVTAERGGFVHPQVRVGEWVDDGAVVALVRDPCGDVVEEIKAPAAGYVLSYPHHGNHAAASGDIVVFVAPQHSA